MNPIILILIFIAATLIGYKIIKNVPSLLHTPLMSGMNGLSGVTILGALTAAAVHMGNKILGFIASYRIKMIQMPQVVALLNGFGGAASALVAFIAIADGTDLSMFGLITGGISLVIGTLTLTGSLIASGKLHQILNQKPVIFKRHQLLTTTLIILNIGAIILILLNILPVLVGLIGAIILSGAFGIVFSIRIGGADMPITISLLNSLSGVAGAYCWYDHRGSTPSSYWRYCRRISGLLLTQIMCRSMNRKLGEILTGKTSVSNASPAPAKEVIIVPGYGMALAQAQNLVKSLADQLEARGTEVIFAMHPVAGRMPGHMNVLLCEVDVPYEKLWEMDQINPEFKNCDMAIVVGANDVINPAARTAKGTPIYGMPILNVDEAPEVIICNFDTKPGYAGIDNPLYEKTKGVTLLLGDAKETLKKLLF